MDADDSNVLILTKMKRSVTEYEGWGSITEKIKIKD